MYFCPIALLAMYILQYAVNLKCSTPKKESKNNKKFWEELIAYFPLIPHAPHIKTLGGRHRYRQQGDLIIGQDIQTAR
jgi:hypothetical protein